METEYRHTQFGALTLIILLVTGILIAPTVLSILTTGRVAVAFAIIGLYLLILALFFSFTVKISGDKLRFWFGIGVIGKSYPLQDIHSTQEVINPWYYLWGIKSIPGGWLYAIAPGEAVEIVLKNGKIIHIGTNQSKKLRQVIDDAIVAN